ncbi:MAG TPA: glycosyltransferase family 2 protein [Candidatus Polarisedimenticolaceae bacterium]
MPPAVTAAIPTYRRVRLLERAVRSVLAQSWPDSRVFVCDNASDDATAAVLRDLADRDPRVRFHRHADNLGAYANFQFAVDGVDTPYFSILSDDDLLLPDFYRRAVEVLERDRDLGFYATPVVMYDVRRGTHGLFPPGGWRAGRHEAGESVRLMTEEHFVWTGVVFRREVRDAIGAFVTIPMGDILFLGSAAARFPFFVDPRPGALFSETGMNASQTLPVGELRRSATVLADWVASLPNLGEGDRREVAAIADRKLKLVAHGWLRDAAEAGDFERFLAAADYLERRGDLDARRARKIAFGRHGGWRFRSLSAWARLQSGYKRRKSSGFKTRSIDEILAAYGK